MQTYTKNPVSGTIRPNNPPHFAFRTTKNMNVRNCPIKQVLQTKIMPPRPPASSHTVRDMNLCICRRCGIPAAPLQKSVPMFEIGNDGKSVVA